MACWIDTQGQVTSVIKWQRHAPIMTSPTENPKPKMKIFFSKSTRRLSESVKGLNSSLAQSTSELWSCKKLQTLVKKVVVMGLTGRTLSPTCAKILVQNDANIFSHNLLAN